MNLTVNGKDLSVDNHITARDLTNQLGYQNQRIALAVNEVIIPRSKHDEFHLNTGDRIEIIKAVGGG